MLWDDLQEVLLTADPVNLSADPTSETTRSDDTEPEEDMRDDVLKSPGASKETVLRYIVDTTIMISITY